MCTCRAIELQMKLDDQTAERRSLADSASSPVDDELRDICDTSFSSDRIPAFRPPPPPLPPFLGYRPVPRFIPFGGRLPPPPDRLHSPPVFAYHDDPFVRESPRPRDTSPAARRRPMPPDHNRSAPLFDNYREETCMRRSSPPRGNSPAYYERPRDVSPVAGRRMRLEHDRSAPPLNSYREESNTGRSPPLRGNSPLYYERRDGRQSPPTFDEHRRDEHYGRHSPLAHENYARTRDRYSRRDRSRTPSDEDSSTMPSRVRSHPPPREERYQQSYPSRYMSDRHVVGPGARPPNLRSPPPLQNALDDDYPTY